MKVYITKYAITQGIYVTEVEPCKADPNFVYRTWRGMNSSGNIEEHTALYKPDEWHTTLEDAKKRTRELIAWKINCLHRREEELEKLREGDIKIMDELRNCIGTAALREDEENCPKSPLTAEEDSCLSREIRQENIKRLLRKHG